MSAWFWIAEVYRKSNELQKAEGALLRQITEYPDAPVSADALHQLAEAAYENNEFSPCLQYLRQLIDRFPDSDYAPHAQYRIGQTHLQQGRIMDTENHFRELLSRVPAEKYADYAQLGLARVALARKSFVDAEAFLDEVLKNSSNELAAEAQFLKGDLAYDQENYQTAGLNYLKVKYLFGQYPYWVVRGVYGAGLSYEKLEQKTEAIKLYRSILQSFPDTEFARLAREHIDQIAGRR